MTSSKNNKIKHDLTCMLGKVLKEANKNEKMKGTKGQEVQNFNL